MNNFIKVLVCIILVGIIGFGGYYAYDVIADNINAQVETESKDNVANIDSVGKIEIEDITGGTTEEDTTGGDTSESEGGTDASGDADDTTTESTVEGGSDSNSTAE